MSGIGAPSVSRGGGSLNQTKKFQFANLSSEESEEDLKDEISSTHSNQLINQLVSQEPFCNKLDDDSLQKSDDPAQLSSVDEPLLQDSIEEAQEDRQS